MQRATKLHLERSSDFVVVVFYLYRAVEKTSVFIVNALGCAPSAAALSSKRLKLIVQTLHKTVLCCIPVFMLIEVRFERYMYMRRAAAADSIALGDS